MAFLAVSKGQNITISPRFFTFASLVQRRLKVSYYFSFCLILYFSIPRVVWYKAISSYLIISGSLISLKESCYLRSVCFFIHKVVCSKVKTQIIESFVSRFALVSKVSYYLYFSSFLYLHGSGTRLSQCWLSQASFHFFALTSLALGHLKVSSNLTKCLITLGFLSVSTLVSVSQGRSPEQH